MGKDFQSIAKKGQQTSVEILQDMINIAMLQMEIAAHKIAGRKAGDTFYLEMVAASSDYKRLCEEQNALLNTNLIAFRENFNAKLAKDLEGLKSAIKAAEAVTDGYNFDVPPFESFDTSKLSQEEIEAIDNLLS